MNIEFIDLKANNSNIQKSALKKIAKIIKSSDFILGDEVRKFEEDFSEYLKVNYCVSLGSGTDGILLSLLALNIKSGDEVIVPSFTFSASISPIMMLGAKPILVDSLSDSPLVDPKRIAEAITKKTKAIIVVHLYGFSCNMTEIQKIARKNKLPIIEDAAQAHGSTYRNIPLGSIGSLGVFSFYPTKNLGAFGDAGAVVTSSKQIADKLRMLRNHGQLKKNAHILLGTNSRMDTIQASILRLKLKNLERENNKRRKIASLYIKLLKDLPLIILKTPTDSLPNFHIFPIRTKKRDNLKKFLAKNGILSGLYYPQPIHQQPFFKKKFGNLTLPNSETLSKEILALPMYPNLSSNNLRKITSTIRSFYSK